jgi:hypothetical protein
VVVSVGGMSPQREVSTVDVVTDVFVGVVVVGVTQPKKTSKPSCATWIAVRVANCVSSVVVGRGDGGVTVLTELGVMGLLLCPNMVGRMALSHVMPRMRSNGAQALTAGEQDAS